MDCPICNHKGLEAGTVTCPSCKTDLAAYWSLNKAAGAFRKQKMTSLIFIILFFIALLAFLLTYFLAGPAGTSKEDEQKMAAYETTIQTLTSENQQLKVSVAEMKAKESELMAQIEAATPKETTHVIKEGETLYDIARNYLGNGNLYPKIAADNGIDDPDLIVAGKEITIHQ